MLDRVEKQVVAHSSISGASIDLSAQLAATAQQAAGSEGLPAFGYHTGHTVTTGREASFVEPQRDLGCPCWQDRDMAACYLSAS